MGIIESILQQKKEEKIYDKELIDRQEKEFWDLVVKTPIYCGNPGPPPIDYSHAISLVIDGPCLKSCDEPAFDYLLHFVRCSRQHCFLQLFRHAGNGNTVKAYTGKELEAIDAFREIATTAIDQYNGLIKKHKLKLEKLLKVVSVYNKGPRLNMTFSAIDMDSGTSAQYYASILELRGHQLLGLLTVSSTKKYLAVLHLSGAGEEELAVKKKIPISNVLRTIYGPVRAQLNQS